MNNNSLILTPSWELQCDNAGVPVLVNRHDEERYKRHHTIVMYPSWGWQIAGNAVRRAAKMKSLDVEELALVEAFCGEKKIQKENHLHIRISKDQKERFMKQAKAAGKPLSEWVLSKLE